MMAVRSGTDTYQNCFFDFLPYAAGKVTACPIMNSISHAAASVTVAGKAAAAPSGAAVLPGRIRVTEAGRPFIRNICMAFDARLWRSAPQSQLFSKAI
jgi:coproporphyrinogen III oxidase-like Fe-S oxidoreductase